MDTVRKSRGFRTSQEPFQENSSQGSEVNKGQKSTPLRRGVCPLERLATRFFNVLTAPDFLEKKP